MRYNIGVCDYNSGKYSGAIEEWKMVLSRLPDFVVEVNISQAEIMLHHAARIIPEYEAAITEHENAILKGIKEEEKRERYLALSKYTNNLAALAEMSGKNISEGYWQALEYAAKGGGECSAAYRNMERKLRKVRLTTIGEGLCKINEEYGYSIAKKEKKRLEMEVLKKFYEERERKEREQEYKAWQYEAQHPKKKGGHLWRQGAWQIQW